MVKLPIVGQVISLVRKAPPPGASGPRDVRFRALFDCAPVGIACIASDGQFLQFNERFREIVGYTRDQLTRLTFNDLTHPDDAKVEAALVRRLLRGDIPFYRIEKRVIEKKGRYRDVTVVAAPAQSETGDFLIYVVDEVSRGKGTARENEQFLAGMIERMTELAVIRTDDKGTIVGWNAGAERVFGYGRDEVIGKSRRMLYRDPDNWEGKATEQLGVANDSGRLDLDDWRVAKNGSHFWVHTSITPLHADGRVRGYIEVVSEPGGLAGRGAQQFRAAAEAKLSELKHSVDDMRSELTRRERTEESLRQALEELRVVGEETMNELRIMTVALRKEIDRRKSAEEELRVLKETPPAVAAEPLAEEEPSTGPLPPSRSWKKLKAMSPAELLVQHAAEARSGRLLFTRGEEEVEISFEKGKVFSVSSNDPSRFLTQRLIALGMLSEEQRRKALEIQRETHLALGRILIILGAVTEDQLLHVMRGKAEDEIESVIDWREGKWAFVEGNIPTLQVVPLRIDVAALVVQRLNRHAPLPHAAIDTPLAAEIRSIDDELPRLANEFDDGTPLAIELEPPPEPDVIEELLVASASGKSRKFHRTSCPNARRFDEDTRVIFTSVGAALHAGYDACRVCFR